MTTKTEGIAETSTYLTLLGLVECEIQIVVNLGILVASLMVDGGRHDIILNGQYGSHCLYSTGSTQQVTGHRLRRRDVELEGCITEYLLDGLGLRDISHMI